MDTNYTQHVRLSDQITNLNGSFTVVHASRNSNFNTGLVLILYNLKKFRNELRVAKILFKVCLKKHILKQLILYFEKN